MRTSDREYGTAWCSLWAAGVVVGLLVTGAVAEPTNHLCISGVYPHLAAHNQPDDAADRPSHGEAGIGAIVPWAGKLWYLTYPQHKTTGSNDKLYEVDERLNLTVRPESVGGTHACRMIHKETNQLIIGPYFIDAKGNVRHPDLKQLCGRMTAVMRHLVDPANLVYFYDMEGALYEVNVHTLAVKKLFDKPVPGWHGKGGYTAEGRVVIANNGEAGNPAAYKNCLVGGKAEGDEAGVLAEWDGETWRIVERKQFLDVTGPGGLYGSPDDNAPLWTFGWDKRSIILKLLDGGDWYTYRMPKASHTFDPRHGWFTEWPRIREIAPGKPMMCAHGGMYDFPIGFTAAATGGIRPICTHLRYIPDYTYWLGKILLGADDSSMMANPMCGQAQSNIWFGEREALDRFGPRAGWGGVWVGDTLEAGDVSVPYLFAGYAQRTLHFAVNSDGPVHFDLEVDGDGRGTWKPLRTVTVANYAYLVFSPDTAGEWIRIKADRPCIATAYFHYWSPRPSAPGEAALFDAVAEAGHATDYAGGLIRPAAHNRGLQWLRRTVGADGKPGPDEYLEIELAGTSSLAFDAGVSNRAAEVEKVARVMHDFDVDAASVIVKDRAGNRWRLPKGAAAYDAPFPTGWPRGVRECISERYLANFHGTFYEIPRTGEAAIPNYRELKPVCSHNKLIADYCTWRGLLVIAGARLGAAAEGQFFAGADGRGLWFGMIDDLWKLGKPVGHGGPWKDAAVKADQPSDPYLMTGYDKKRVALSHTLDQPVAMSLEIDMDLRYFRPFKTFVVPPGETVTYAFPEGYHAHWVRVKADKACTATVLFDYE